MDEVSECAWITEVLRDIEAFLVANRMAESSAVISAAAARLELDINARSNLLRIAVAVVKTQNESNVIAFAPRRRLRA